MLQFVVSTNLLTNCICFIDCVSSLLRTFNLSNYQWLRGKNKYNHKNVPSSSEKSINSYRFLSDVEWNWWAKTRAILIIFLSHRAWFLVYILRFIQLRCNDISKDTFSQVLIRGRTEISSSHHPQCSSSHDQLLRAHQKLSMIDSSKRYRGNFYDNFCNCARQMPEGTKLNRRGVTIEHETDAFTRCWGS